MVVQFFREIAVYILSGASSIVGVMGDRMRFALSAFVRFILYDIVKYRVGVVRSNLRNSFPSYSKEQLMEIEKKFYTHLSDVMVEMVAMVSISKRNIAKRMIYTNIDEVKRGVGGRVGLLVSAHYGSWEYSAALPMSYDAKCYGVYHPLSSKVADVFFKRFRSRFGITPLPMSIVAKSVVRDIQSGESSVYGLIADQTPPRPIIRKWMMFLNQPTPFVPGPEKLAMKYHLPVYFFDLRVVKRGYYEGQFIQIYDGNESVEPYEITRRYAKELERMITREPHLWMWSHRRWKHKPKSDSDII